MTPGRRRRCTEKKLIPLYHGRDVDQGVATSRCLDM
jgi:hypothetical protein